LFLVPSAQIEGVPGLSDNEICNLEMFQHSLRQVRSVKKDLELALKRRAGKSISNIRLPSLEGHQERYKPSKHFPSF